VLHLASELRLFDRYGLLYERKRGEFSDGLDAGYVDQSQILERNLFLRLFLSSQGELNHAMQKRIFVKHKLTATQLTDPDSLELFADSYVLFRRLSPKSASGYQAKYRDVLAKVYLGVHRTDKGLNIEDRCIAIERMWEDLTLQVAKNRPRFTSQAFDQATGMKRDVFSRDKWNRSNEYQADIREFVQTGQIMPLKESVNRNEEATEEFRKALDSTFPEGAVAPKK
jgi:hypothetical protein